MYTNLKAIFLTALLLLCMSRPAISEQLAEQDSQSRKFENIRLMQEKSQGHEDKGMPATQSVASADAKESGSGTVLRLFQGLGLCIAVFLFGVHFYKKHVLKVKSSDRPSLRIIERLALNGKSQLCLVEAMDKKLLLAVGPDKITFFQENEVLNSFANYSDLSLLEPEKEPCKQDIN